MLLTSMQVIPRSQHEEQSALLRCKVEELNKNTARLIAEAEEIIPRIETAIGTDQVFRKPPPNPKRG